jgi:kynurenine formamidase
MPCWWAEHMPYQHKTFNYFTDSDEQQAHLMNRSGAYQTRWLLIDEHTGTHFDAPAHFIPEAATGLPHAGPAGELTADRIPLEQMMGPAVVVSVPADLPGSGPGISPFITQDVVLAHEKQHGEIEAGSVVLFNSGWDRNYRPGPAGNAYCFDVMITRSGPGWPAPDPDTMRLLLSRGVRCVGIDAPSMGAAHDGAPVHLVGLAEGAVFVEALAGLHRLPPTGAWFCFAPLNLKHGSGAPGRAFALVS